MIFESIVLEWSVFLSHVNLLSQIILETCNCPSHLTTTFRLLPPYVMKIRGTLQGIIPELIQQMTEYCCVPCSAFSVTQIDFNQDGYGKSSMKISHPELLDSFDEATTFAFPIYGYMEQTHYRATYGFIPGVRSPGMVVIVRKKSPGSIAAAVISSIFETWPLLVIIVLSASIAGCVMWMLVSYLSVIYGDNDCVR